MSDNKVNLPLRSGVGIVVLNKNNKVFGLKRPNSQLRNIHNLKDKIELINGDLIDQSSMMNLIEKVEPDEIYHLGAMSWVTPSWSMPAAYMQTNAIGTINLFEAMRFLGSKARVLISCTPEEFGDVPEHMIPILLVDRFTLKSIEGDMSSGKPPSGNSERSTSK